jgi:5-hydroxyisourate hydrolase-like protein (transthyretin family)
MGYKKLLKKHTPEELAEAFVFPVKLTAKQKKEAARQLAEARKKTQQEMTEETRLSLNVYQLRFQLEDYLDSEEYNPELNFGHFLKRYVDLLDRKRKAFAEDISIDETLLSQLINSHRLPPDYIVIRLEIHSNAIIPATLWARLVEKQRLHEIETDQELRNKERPFVHGKLAIKLSA